MLLLIRLLGAALAVAAAPLVLTPMVDRRRPRRAPSTSTGGPVPFSTAHGIDYWADFGTLLGFRREADIIRSDKDAILSVMAEEKARIVALAPAFARAGMELNAGAWSLGPCASHSRCANAISPRRLRLHPRRTAIAERVAFTH
jgi:hypothetical protein